MDVLTCAHPSEKWKCCALVVNEDFQTLTIPPPKGLGPEMLPPVVYGDSPHIGQQAKSHRLRVLSL